MKIIHRLSFISSENGCDSSVWKRLEIPYVFSLLPAPDNVVDPLGMVTIEIAESDARWEELRALSNVRNGVDIIRTKFSTTECNQAKHLALSNCWQHGYPMPDGDSSYLSITYDGAGCTECGIGFSQQAPFRFKSEPRWGNKQILQPFWILDEYFVSLDAYESVFKPLGISARIVLNHKTDKPLQSVLQLVVDSIANSDFVSSGPFDEVCSKCGLGKFHPHTRGFFPGFESKEGGHIFKTREYFGSGGAAGKAVIVSNELYRAMVAFGLKGIHFYPVEGRTTQPLL